MAATATDILPVDEALRQIGIEPADLDETARSALEARITPQIEAAISFVEQETSLVLVDRPDRWREVCPPSDTLACIPVTGAYRIREVTRLDYWTPDAPLSALPDGSLAGSEFRYEAWGERAPNGVLFPPADGWPEMQQGTQHRLVVTEGLAEVPAVLIQAARLLTAANFDGLQRLDETAAAIRLCRQVAYYGGL